MNYFIGVEVTAKFAVGPKRRTTTMFTVEVETKETGEKLQKQVLQCVEDAIRPVSFTSGLEQLTLNVNLKKQLVGGLPLESGQELR